MNKHLSAIAALGAALSLATFAPSANAAHMGGHMGGHMNHMGHGPHFADNFGHGHGGHWRGGGGWWGWGPGIYLGDDYYDDDYDYGYCYWRHGRRFCRY